MANDSFNPRTKRNVHLTKWKILFEKDTNHWISFKPQVDLEVYPCYACRDMFGSKTSFLDHVNRRGILLVYQCPYCRNQSYVFYNPCSLLLHTRQHYTFYGGQINLANIKVSTVPLGLAGFLPHPDVAMIFNVIDDNIENTISNINTKFYNPLPQNMGQQIVNMVPTVLLFYNSVPSMSLALKQISSNIPRCKFVVTENALQTSVINPNIQKHTVEPICINNTVNNLNSVIKPEPLDIVEDNCTSVFRLITPKNEINHEASENAVVNRCLECGIVQETTMSVHFVNNNNQPHNERFKCTICKYIAPSQCSLQAHRRIHDGSPPYVCPECGKVFGNGEELFDHSDDVCFHLAKQVRFRCPKKNCCKVFAQSTTFFAHFAAHILTYTKCLICHVLFNAISDYLEHTKILHGNAVLSELIYKCTICKNGGPPFTETGYKNHIKWHGSNQELSVYVYVCKFCRNFFRSTLTYANHLLRCSKKSLLGDDLRRIKRSNTATICDNCNYIIRIITRIPNCPKCGEPFNTPYTVKSNSTEIVNSSELCILCSEKYIDGQHRCKYRQPIVVLQQNYGISTASPKSDDGSRRKRKKQSTPPSLKKKLGVAGLEPIMEPQLDKPLPFDGIYRCKLCEYTEESRNVFHEHIVTHRDISTAYQCMECGDCFLVKPSLQKHLLYYHQISDIEVYIKENPCFDKNASNESKEVTKSTPEKTEEPEVAENQCKVCFKQFQDSLELNKHFRIHGMAFLLKNCK